MSRVIAAAPLTRAAFAPFGQVIETAGAVRKPMNAGRAERYANLAQVEVAGPGGRAAISLCRSDPAPLPYSFDLVERHPLGSQAFYPLSANPFLVMVAPDEDGTPGTPLAFITGAGQGINLRMNTWHGVLTPLIASADFLIVDRIGEGDNLVEHRYSEPWVVEAA
jgi:ureidoglycolate lyase